MRWFLALCAATFSLASIAQAAEPTGEWRVANGDAYVRIDDCDLAALGCQRRRDIHGEHALADAAARAGKGDGRADSGKIGANAFPRVGLLDG